MLGPMLFIFYINDVVNIISQSRISMFADDCILYVMGNDFDQMYGKFQSDLNAFITWCTINSYKTKAMISSTRPKQKTLSNARVFQNLGNSVHYVVQYKYLGLILDQEMSLQSLFKNIKKRVSNKLFSLRKFFLFFY